MSGLLKLVGMVDPHVHLRDMEWAHKATFQQETSAAIAGGYWAIFDMPNTPPHTLTPAALDHKLATIQAGALCDWGLYFGASGAGNWDHYSQVSEACCGLKIYNNPTTGNLFITDPATREAHYQAWPAHRVIAVHAEADVIPAIVDLVRRYRKWTHFCHISSAEELNYVIAAKQEGLPVSMGVTPHHLYLSQDDLPRLGPLGLMKPELKTPADCQALWEALVAGWIDVVESDHAPHTLAEKQSATPPYGVAGLETTLPLLGLAIKEGRLSLDQVTAFLTTNSHRIFNLTVPADTYTLVDFDASYVLERSQLRSACGWSPFEGMRLYGRVREVWIRGQQVFDGENILVPAGFGQRVVVGDRAA